MKISILVFDLSSNCLVRTYPIAKVLERHYEIEVIGPVLREGIFEPYKNEFFYKTVPVNHKASKLLKIREEIFGMREIVNNITGDVIYAFKPRIASFGMGLLSKYVKTIPLVLDIEDWEAVSFYNSSFIARFASVRRFYNPNNMLYNRLMEPLTKLADTITVVSGFLQNRFGGVKLPHGTDCNFFDPLKYNRERLRDEYNVNDKYIILFAGTPHPHKGIEELIKALEILSLNTVCLLVVGYQTEYLRKLLEKYGSYIISVGPQPHSDMPKFLSMADLVVLPQRNVSSAQAQVPGKVFEAMAMAKPIIATKVSDLPEILDDCGWVVEPENPEQLTEAILFLLNNPKEANEMGWRARRKCIEKYSWDAMEQILLNVFRKYE